jgi:hypothetical protein
VTVIDGTGMMKFVARPEQVRSDGPALDMLCRARSNGGWVPQVEDDPSSGKYASSDLAIHRYDETNNRIQIISLEQAVRVSRRFVWPSGDIDPTLRRLVDKLNAGGNPNISLGDDDSYFGDMRKRAADGPTSDIDVSNRSVIESIDAAMGKGISAEKLVDLALYWTPSASGPEGLYRVVSFIGDMELPYLTHRDVHAAARSIVDRLEIDAETRRDFEDLIALMQEIDNTKPNQAYLEALLTANATSFKNPRGTFADTDTAGGDLKGDGTLGLPKGNAAYPKLPFGFANYRGMRLLAANVDAGAAARGEWSSAIFQRAAKGMKAFDALFGRWQVAAADSPFFWADNACRDGGAPNGRDCQQTSKKCRKKLECRRRKHRLQRKHPSLC